MFPQIFRAADMPTSGGSEQVFLMAEGNEILLPEGFDPTTATFARAGPDLMLTSPDGQEVIIADFFMGDTPPALVSANGSRLSGEFAAILAEPHDTSNDPAQSGMPNETIGRVATLTGEVWVVHADGTREVLHAGDPIFLGDSIETTSGAGVGLLLLDGTSASMAELGRMVLDDVIYDPASQTGNVSFHALKGVFTVVTSEATIHTPQGDIVAATGQFGMTISDQNGLALVVMENAQGAIANLTVTNAGGSYTLNKVFDTLSTTSYNVAPDAALAFNHGTLLSTYGVTFAFLPTEIDTPNDYGLHEVMAKTHISADGLAGFDAAGGEDVLIASAGEDVAALVTDAGGEPDVVDGAPVDEPAPLDDVKFSAAVEPMDVAEGIAAAAMGEIAPVTAAEPVSESAPIPEPAPEPALAPEPEPEQNRVPTAEPGTVITTEDSAFLGQLSAVDLDGDDLSYTIADGGEATNGYVVVGQDGSFEYTPNVDFSGDDSFTYQVSDGAGGISAATVVVAVTAVADNPVLAVAQSSGNEDTGIALVIAAAMPAHTSEMIASITIANVPAGASLSAGTDNGEGTWSLNVDELTGLILTPPQDFGGAIDLNVTAMSTDGGTTSQDLTATVAPVVDVPTLTVADVIVNVDALSGEEVEADQGDDELTETAGGDVIDGDQGDAVITDGLEQGIEQLPSLDEDRVVPLDINSALTDVDGSEALSLEISGVPEASILSFGTYNGDGTWSLVGEDLNHLDDLTMTLSEGLAATDFDLTVTSTSSELDTGEMATTTAILNVNFEAPQASSSDDQDDEGQDAEIIDGDGVDNVTEVESEDDTDTLLDLGETDELSFDGPQFSAEDASETKTVEETSTIILGADTDTDSSVAVGEAELNPDEGYTVAPDAAQAPVNVSADLET